MRRTSTLPSALATCHFVVLCAAILIACSGCRGSKSPQVSKQPIKYLVLKHEDFNAEYQKAFQKKDFETESDKGQFRDAVFTVQGAVEEALKKKWDPRTDFEVGWDFDYCYHTCGGIYSDRIFCSEYVEEIASTLRSVDPNGIWTYHTVCEILVNPEAKTIGESMERRGEFFIRGGICYIDGSTMSLEWRKRLGCPT